MFRNRLFIKIYFWFLLATIIPIVIIIIIDTMIVFDSAPEHLRRHAEYILSYYGQMAADIYEKENPESLNRFVNYIEETTGFHIYLYSAEGKEISGQKALPEISRLLAEMGKDDKRNIIVSRNEKIILKAVNSHKLKKYIVAAEITHGFPPLPPRQKQIPPSAPLLSLPLSSDMPLLPPPPPKPPFGLSFILFRVFVILALSGVICYLLFRYLKSPLTKLENATRQLAAGNFSTRVAATMGNRKDEISSLALDFDFMAERIEQLLTSQHNLLRDISHELRSPLTRLNLALELCRQHSNAESQKHLERIANESDKLNNLISQILTLNRAQSGIAQLAKEEIDITRLVQEIAADADFEAKSRNRFVAVNIKDAVIVKGNEELIYSAIENIVRNAVFYTREGSTVEIFVNSIQKDGQPFALIKVRDYGDGISEDELEKIFKPFYRVDENRDRRTGGEGIGLAITDAAVKIHGGSIRAANASNCGLIIEMLLPIYNGA